jgi:LysR family transcriptional regulator, glycine cleavage system transcriptional activator
MPIYPSVKRITVIPYMKDRHAAFAEPLPPLQTLRAFVAVASTKSFTKAAEKLRVTQTAVSHQIAQLEAWIGGRLFVRDRRGITLTALGKMLIPRITDALAGLAQAIDEARRTIEDKRLRISTTPEFAAQWLAPRLGTFCAAHPEIDVGVTIEYRRVRIGVDQADVAIWLAGSLPRQFDAERLTADREFVVCSPGLAQNLPEREGLRTASLLRYEGARHTVLDWRRWYSLVYGTGNAHPGMGAAEKAGGIDFDNGPLYPTFPDMIEACRRGAGFALVRTSLVANDLESRRLVQCFDEQIQSDLQYHLVISPTRRGRTEVITFREWIRAQ